MKGRALLTTLALLALAQSATAQGASMFRGNLAHTGVYDSPAIPHLTGVKWKFHTDGRIIGSPAVVAGTAYVGSTDGYFYAVNAQTGAQKWKFKTGVRITSSAAVADGRVFFESYDANLYALDAATGALVWKFATAGERRFAAKHLHGNLPAGETMPDPWDVYLSSPAVWKNTVYFGSGDGDVYALDEATGHVKWQFHTGDVVHASPAIANGILYVGSYDSWFYALNATTGTLVWKFKTGEDHKTGNQMGIASSAAIADGTVYFGCRDAHLYAVDARTGAKKWAYDAKGSWVISSPAIRDGRVYAATSDSRLLLALDARSGQPILSLPNGWFFFGSPAIAGNMLYIGNWDGKLTALDLTSLKPAWVFQTDSSKRNLARYTQPDGNLNYRAATTEPFYDDLAGTLDRLWSVGSFLSSPVVVDGVIYVGSVDGFLYALT